MLGTTEEYDRIKDSIPSKNSNVLFRIVRPNNYCLLQPETEHSSLTVLPQTAVGRREKKSPESILG